MSDLDDLERELGPALRSALHRVAANITVSPDAPMTEGKLMNYVKTPVDHEPSSDRDGGRRRSRRVLIAVAVLAAAAIVVAVIALVRSGQDDDGGPVEEPAVTTAQPTATSDNAAAAVPPDTPFFLDLGTGERTPLADSIASAFVHSYVASPDGTRLVFNTCCADKDVQRVSAIDGTDSSVTATPDGQSNYGAHWSPDGTKLVYQHRDGAGRKLGSLIVHDVATGATMPVTDFGPTSNEWWFLGPRFSADGSSVIYHLPRESTEGLTWDAWSVPATGGEPTLWLENALFPLPLPDGEIAFVTPTNSLLGDSISIASADGSSRRPLVEADGIFEPALSPDGARIAYQANGAIYVVDVATGEASKVADRGNTVAWRDDDTLIVQPAQA